MSIKKLEFPGDYILLQEEIELANLPNKENKERFVRDLFNSIARRYDLMNSLMTVGRDKAWRKLTVVRSGIKEGGYALDVCCGTGMLSMELVKTIGAAGKVVGLDFSENMLSVARENVKEFPLRDSIRFVQGNAMELPFEDNSFDCATVGWGLRNVPDTSMAVSEMARVVKPGGKVVSLDMAQPTVPVFKQGYWLFFEKVVPAMGKLWAGNKGAYGYLHDSARAFPPQWELAEIFKRAGLVQTGYSNLMGGAVAIVEGTKPKDG